MTNEDKQRREKIYYLERIIEKDKPTLTKLKVMLLRNKGVGSKFVENYVSDLLEIGELKQGKDGRLSFPKGGSQ